MNKTHEIYYDNAYQKTFDAKILDIIREDNDTVKIVLDKTAFFPESGGQPSDKGTLGNLEVIHAEIHEGIIYHICRDTKDFVLKIGDDISGEIDFKYRFSNMQQHTGEHIFSGIVYSKYGYENVGFHLSDNTVTMDYDGPLTEQEIMEIETLTNETISKNLPITASFPDSGTLESMQYRAKLDASEMGKVRIVEIEGVDKCACCAPHVSTTAEVGLLKVVDFINYKGGMRLTILCGDRAIKDYCQKHNTLINLSHRFSAPITEIENAILKQEENITAMKESIIALEENLVELSLSNSLINENIGNVLFLNVNNKILVRNTANKLMEKDTILLFNGDDTKGYSFIFASNTKDVAALLGQLGKSLQIRGGGKNPMVQGSCQNTKEQILKALQDLG